MSASDSQELDKLLSQFFFGCNIPFRIVDSDHFKRFIKKLNPLYKPPTRKTLSNKILNDRYTEFQQSIEKSESKDAVLLIDGWKNSSANSKNVVGMLRLRNGKHVYLDSSDFTTLRETGEALAEVVNYYAEIAREKYNINIFAVITDNASNMMCMGRMVNMWHATCNSHSGNLLCKSLTDCAFSAKVNKLLKEFKAPALERAITSRGGNRMVLVGETRWCSHRDAFRRCLKNLPIMREISNTGQHEIKPEHTVLLTDDSFETELQDYILIFDPVCELINECQKNDCNLARATELWLKLTIPTENDEYKKILTDRLRKVIKPCGLAANFLNPSYRGNRFRNDNTYIRMMNEFFQSVLTPNGLNELDDYKNSRSVFRKLFQKMSFPVVHFGPFHNVFILS